VDGCGTNQSVTRTHCDAFYIFGHVLYTDQPLEGKALVHDIITIAQNLPGYHDWCQHQQEVEKRAQEWMQAIEQSRYFHYGTDKRPAELNPDLPDASEPSWNQQQQAEARARIQQAIADLLEKAALPSGITERFDALVTYGLSGATLYRHRDLWHPRHLQSATIGALQSAAEPDCSWAASGSDSHTNLLSENGCKTLSDGSSGALESVELRAIGCNTTPTGDLSHTGARNMTQEEGIAYIKQVLNQIKARRQVETAQKRQRLTGRNQLLLPFGEGLE
jgi:polyhydroxyalkanoate synthesis regulator phasin